MSLKQNIYGSLFVSNNITGGTLTLSTVNKDNSLTQILARNSSGLVEYVDVNSIISGATSQDTFVTGGTYNDTTNNIDFSGNSTETTFDVDLTSLVSSVSANTFVIAGTYVDSTNTISLLRNDGNFVNVTGVTNTYVTGGTVSVTATDSNNNGTIGLFYKDSDGTPRTLPFKDTFITGGTYDNGSTTIEFTKNNSTKFDVDLSSLINSVSGDTFVVSGNADAATSLLTFTNNSGGTFNVTNSAALFSDNDINVTGGTYNPTNGCITFGTNSGTTFDVCGFVTGFTDSYTTDAYLSGTEVRFDNSVEGANYYNVDLLPVLSGKTNLTLFNSHTADTNNPHQTSFNNLTSTAHTHTISDVINLQTELDSKLDITTFNTYTANTQTILDDKIDSANNVGGANEFFKDKSGTTLNFRTLSGGSNTTISTLGDVVKVDVTIPTDTNTFVTGFTYNDANTFTISRNDGVDLSTSINTMTGLTVNGSISATTYFGDGSNLTGIDDTFVTGFTYNDANTFTISNNDGTSFNSSINIMTGFTVNNGVGDGFVTINSTSGQELEINQRGNNFNYSTPTIKVGNTGANMMVGSTGGIGSYPAGSYPGLNLNTTTGNIFLFNGGYGGTGAVMDFQGGNIRDIHDIQSSGNWPLKLYGGPGPNDANDGIQMYTADNLNVYTKKFEIKADTGTPNAYFTNINNFGVNTTTPQYTLDVNGTTRLLGLTANTLNLVTTPTLNNSATDILVRNSSTGEVEYRPVSGITPDTNTFVTGTTFSSNQAILSRNDGFEVFKFSGGSNVNLSNPSTNEIKIDVSLPSTMNTFVTGFTYNNSNTFTITDNDSGVFTASINQMTGLTVNGSISATTYFGDGSNLTGISTDDNFVTGGTLNSGTLILERQNGVVTITGFTTDLDTYVTGGTVSVTATNDNNDGTIGLFYKNSEGVPHTLPFKDTFITGGTYNNGSSTIEFTKNDSTTFDVDLSSIDVNDTFSTGGTVTQSATSGSTDVTLQITGNQGFTPYNITGLTDTFVNDFSYSAQTFTITQNDGSTFETEVESVDLANILSGVTFDIATSGSISATTFNGGTFNGTFVGDGSGLTGITDNDIFVTGTTFNSNEATLTRNDGTEVLKITGDTNVVLSNPSTNQIKVGLDLGIKSGFVRGTDFTGNPKTYKVIFTTPYSDTNYSINITGVVNRNYTFQDKTASSFVINANANTPFTDIVDWTTIKYGEQ